MKKRYDAMTTKSVFLLLLATILLATLLACGLVAGVPTPTIVPASVTPVLITPSPVPPTNTSTIEPPTPTIETAHQYADEYIRIVLDKTERMRELPKDFDKPPAEQGREYIVFTLTVTEIKDVHITNMLGSRDNRPTLIVESGDEYPLSVGRVTGIEFSDPTNITSGSELVEDAQCYYAFEIPEEDQPARINLIYDYKQDMEEEDAQSVEFEIEL